MAEIKKQKTFSYAEIIEIVMTTANIEFGHENTRSWLQTRFSDLGDSLDITLFIMELEKTFRVFTEVVIPDEKVEEFKTLEDLVLYIGNCLHVEGSIKTQEPSVAVVKEKHIDQLQEDVKKLENSVSVHRQEVTELLIKIQKATNQIKTIKSQIQALSKTPNLK
jgi:acyl carrier protein